MAPRLAVRTVLPRPPKVTDLRKSSCSFASLSPHHHLRPAPSSIVAAANAQRFNELYASVSDSVFVPKIYSDLTTRKVLVMEWVDGFRLTDNASLNEYGLDRSKLVDTLVQCSLRQILENGTSMETMCV
jgi:ABC1 atypical kinase-like domain